MADDDCLSVLQGMPELEILFLDKIAAFTGTELRFLPKASRLTRLDVCDTEFEQGLEQIDVSALERLIANRTPIGDAGIAPLHDACELQFLWLNDTQVTDNGLMYVVGLLNNALHAERHASHGLWNPAAYRNEPTAVVGAEPHCRFTR
ncbi:MAG: hypothetical protein U0992_11765 [Planctomycetaceae bacterium]